MKHQSIIKNITKKQKLSFNKYKIILDCNHYFIFDESVTPYDKAFSHTTAIPCKKCFFNKKEL